VSTSKSKTTEPLAATKPSVDGKAASPLPEPTLEHISIDQIDQGGNPRKLFDPAALDELAESIRAVGLMQPIVVAEIGEIMALAATKRQTTSGKPAAPERKFPETSEDHHAVALYEYGMGLHATIGEALADGRVKDASASAVVLSIAAAHHSIVGWTEGYVHFKKIPLVKPDVAKKFPARVAEPTEFGLSTVFAEGMWHDVGLGTHHYRPALDYVCDKPNNVPLPPAAVWLIACFEALCKRWKIKHDLKRPTPSNDVILDALVARDTKKAKAPAAPAKKKGGKR